MPVSFYMDVHIPAAVTQQLRRRGIDVLSATEERTNRLSDVELLELATKQGRVLFTHDIRLRSLAEQYQREGIEFGGLLFGPAEGASIGHYVRDLELIGKASDSAEWRNTVGYLPL